MIKPSDDDDTNTVEGHKFYHNSVAHMVSQKQARDRLRHHGNSAWHEDLDETDDSFLSAASASDLELSHPVERLSFEMWVSAPTDQERALHYYAGLKSEKLASTPLEDLAGWRLSFPHLEKLVNRGMRLNNCDLILLDTSLKLMQEFPPRHSKLGVGLELKFPKALCTPDSGQGAVLRDWICTTYMYREGVLVSEPAREECQVSEHWKVRPFFQSKWWASTFTSLTEARKVAEDSKDPEAIELANEQSRKFFQGLTIMQEISAHQYVDGWPRDKRTRMAILLWKFSQAPADSAGAATWQNLIAPPERLTTNSPPPSGTDMDLPHLSMDSIVSPGIHSFNNNNQFVSQNNMQYSMYPDGLDEELCHDEFMGLKPDQIHDFGHLQPSFNVSSPQGYAGVDPSLHDTFNLTHGSLSGTVDDHQTVKGNLFELPHTQTNTRSGIHGQVLDDDRNPRHQSQDRPLSRFDVTTHQVLQEQLNANEATPDASAPQSPITKSEPSPALPDTLHGRTWSQQLAEDEIMLQILAAQQQQRHAELQPGQPWAPAIDKHEEALRNALLAASAMSDLGRTSHLSQTPRPQHSFSNATDEQHRHDEPHWMSPMPFRPILQSYHTFPAVKNDEHFHRLSFGVEHHEDGLSLSQPLPHLDGHRFIDHQLSAVSAPADFLHASCESHDEVTRGLPRAHNEPDPNLPGAPELYDGAQRGSMTDRISSSFQTHSLSSIAPEDLHLGGSFVEVSMEDVQG